MINNSWIIKIVRRNYFMVRTNIPFTQYSSGSTPLPPLSSRSLCPMTIFLSRFIPSSYFFTTARLSSSLSQAISPTTQPGRFPFFSTYPMLHPHLVDSGNVPLHPIESLDLTPLKHSNIVRYSEFDLLCSIVYLLSNDFW